MVFLVAIGCSTRWFDAPATTPEPVPRVVRPVGTGVMMQAFYWDVPRGGTWWDTVGDQVDDWGAAGFDALWLPPFGKAHGGDHSMGYDPYDYYDLGLVDQKGTIETRFGSAAELEALIERAHRHGLAVIADIVINHNSGGALERNPFTGTETWTDFRPGSGLFLRSSEDFHPNAIHEGDAGRFGDFPDLCHDRDRVKDALWREHGSVAQTYRAIGVDGWRFDYVKGFAPWVVRDWVQTVGGFAVGELWDGNAAVLERWTRAADAHAFDFAAYYAMERAFDHGDLRHLGADMLWKRAPMHAVTFVTNHDTDEIGNKRLAYAYLLTHEGYPTIFYRDYEGLLDKERLNNLIWIHNHLASGTTDVLHVSAREYVARRNGHGSPGLVVYLNDSDQPRQRWVSTRWPGRSLRDFTGHSSRRPIVEADGRVPIDCPPHSYTVWSVEPIEAR